MSRYKVLDWRWWVAALCAALIVASTSIVSAFGVKLWLPMIAIYVGGIGLFLFARRKGVRHRARYCARCEKTITNPESATQFKSEYGPMVTVCEDCVQEENFLLSLPNRKHTDDNEVRAKRLEKLDLLCFAVTATTFIVSTMLSAGMARGIVMAAFWVMCVTCYLVSRRSSFYHDAYCARCNRDIEQYELRAKHGGSIGVVLCVDCWDERCEDDEEDGEAFAV